MLSLNSLFFVFILGPITYKDNETHITYLIGVVSFGFKCAQPETPGYYASVYPQLTWIHNVIDETNTCPYQDKKEDNSKNCELNSLSKMESPFSSHFYLSFLLFLSYLFT